VSHSTETAPAPSRPAEIQGLVDNATNARLYGWAWNAAQPEEHVAVELRLGEATVAAALADRPRADLAKAGVGDGRHAFELPLKPEWAQRHKELSVLVRAADGTESVLALKVRRADVDPTGSMQRVLEATAASHRQILGELQRIAAARPAEGAVQEDAIRALAAGQSALMERLETLTLWLTRMDERLAALPPPPPPAPMARRFDRWQGVLGGVLGVVLLGAGLGTAALMLLPRG
jgi:hypothetical protein